MTTPGGRNCRGGGSGPSTWSSGPLWPASSTKTHLCRSCVALRSPASELGFELPEDTTENEILQASDESLLHGSGMEALPIMLVVSGCRPVYASAFSH